MARVVATLKAHNNICLAGEEVDDLAFTFIAPLGADDCDVGHNCILDFRLAILDCNRKSRIQNQKSIHNFTRVAETICGSARSSSRAFLLTASSTWVNEIAFPPFSLRPSSMPAMFKPCLPRIVPTAPTTP